MNLSRLLRKPAVWVSLSALVIALAGICLWPSPNAGAAPITKSQISQATSQVQALEAKVQKLNDQVEILVENYDAATVKLNSLNGQVADAKKKLSQANSDYAVAEEVLAQRLVGIYKQGQSFGVEILVSSTSITDLMSRVDVLEYMSKQDTQVVKDAVDYQAKVTRQKNVLASRLKQQQAQTAQLASDKKSVERQYAANQKALEGQQQQVAQLENAYQAQQAQLAAEARAAAAAAAAEAARGDNSGSSGGPVSASGKGAQAVEIAMKYLGVPYVWGDSTPSGFDCSGLVMYVYGKLGVSLPHHAADQYGYGTHVSRSQLEPGDLVFFGDPIHHVGIYVGNGDMINAPHTGAVVRIQPLDADYAGATRIF